MGQSSGSLHGHSSPKKGSLYRAVCVGLDESGKTSFVQRLAREAGESPSNCKPPQQTLGFSVSILPLYLPHGRSKLQIWDPAGREDMRGLWDAYFAKSHVVVFVVDAADRGRLEEARDELQRLLNAPDLLGKPLLVLGNKSDAHGACTPSELEDRLGLHKHAARSRLRVIGMSCVTGAGVDEAKAWLVSELAAIQMGARHAARHAAKSGSLGLGLGLPRASPVPGSEASGTRRHSSLPTLGLRAGSARGSLSVSPPSPSSGSSRDVSPGARSASSASASASSPALLRLYSLPGSNSFDDLGILHPRAFQSAASA
eukprot:tig00000344_g24282.t1